MLNNKTEVQSDVWAWLAVSSTVDLLNLKLRTLDKYEHFKKFSVNV
jgi:hypothetical protein